MSPLELATAIAALLPASWTARPYSDDRADLVRADSSFSRAPRVMTLEVVGAKPTGRATNEERPLCRGQRGQCWEGPT